MGGDASGAGRSAQREYERRRAREVAVRRANRGRAAVLVAVTGPVVYLLVVTAWHYANVWFSPQQIAHAFAPKGTKPSGPRTNLLPVSLEQPIAVLLGVVASLSLAIDFWGRRQTTEAWGTGAAGERETARIIAPLEDRGFVALHDRRMPGSRSNIDHIVIGPSGVWTVESKRFTGVVRLAGGTVRRNGRNADRIVKQAREQGAAVAQALKDDRDRRVVVQPLVVIHRASVERSLFADPMVEGVRFCSTNRLAAVLDEAHDVLSPEQVHDVAACLSARFPPVVRTPAPPSRATAQSGKTPRQCACGGTLVLRHRRSDGRPFWGCSRFPNCRRTEPV